MISIRPAMAVLGLLALGACQSTESVVELAAEPDLMLLSYAAVDDLVAQRVIDDDHGRVLVATLVDVNNVEESSMFGRQVSEFLATRLTQQKVDVIFATVRQDHMKVDRAGQFLISRNVQNLGSDYNARNVLVGTYGVTEQTVMVSLRLVSTVDDSTLAATDFAIQKDALIEQMLAGASVRRF
ncbi:FlgO family outer membrane protein [Planctomycetota bacterium]|jgi:TolB-like protein|nr:FlgO family outer membrane protein [Planctomycetota bacterium]